MKNVERRTQNEGNVKIKIGVPNEKQKLMLRSHKKYIAYGGARGGGKSWAVRTKAKLLAGRYPGIKMLIVRKSYPELKRNHIDWLKKELRGVARYVDVDKKMTFSNGSVIEFAYAENDKALERIQGTEYDVIFVDEATQITESQLRKFNACVRGVNDFPKRIYYTCNPGGPGHGFIKQYFIDRNFGKRDNPDDFEFIQALVDDNTALMKTNPEYVAFLDALPEKQKAAWRYGSWDIFSGKFFDFRDDPQHYSDGIWSHVIDPFDVPANWTYWRSFDYGSYRPFSVGWYAMDFDSHLYRILELYGCTNEPDTGLQWTADQIFEEVARIENTHRYLKGRRINGVADPATWNRESNGLCVQDHAIAHGIRFVPGNNDRINGWDQCRYWMQFDENGRTRFHVFSNCKSFRRTIPLMMHDENRVEDLDTKLEDHIADEFRYLCQMNPVKPIRAPEKKPKFYDPLDQLVFRN